MINIKVNNIKYKTFVFNIGNPRILARFVQISLNKNKGSKPKKK